MYEILNAASESFNVGNSSGCVQKYIHSLVKFQAEAELDLILRKNKEARSLDVNHFHDIISKVKDDQILEVF